ncbi:MAG: hypothetical protein WCL71_17770, partial [Deltaproteobacteria bacterium]
FSKRSDSGCGRLREGEFSKNDSGVARPIATGIPAAYLWPRQRPARILYYLSVTLYCTRQGWVASRGIKGGSAPLARSYRGPDNVAGQLLGHLNPA